MSLRLLHLADVHLDRPFVGMDIESARERRRELRNAFDRCLALARDNAVDLITVGGDLWEDEHVTPDTLRWVADRLARAGVPVVIVAGNHDPLSPGGPYERAGFSDTVRVLPAGPALSEHRIGALSVWGMSWQTAQRLEADVLNRFKVPADGRTHVLLLHGTCGAYFEGSTLNCPFTVAQVEQAGFAYCLAGHLHGASHPGSTVVYPGSPEPLAWSQDGRHTVVVVSFDGQGGSAVEYLDVNQRRYVAIDVPGREAESSAELERLVLDAVGAVGSADGLGVQVTLTGLVARGCSVDPAALRDALGQAGIATAIVRDHTAFAFDLDEIEAGSGVAAGFVRELRAKRATLAADSREAATIDLALELGLRALNGDKL